MQQSSEFAIPEIVRRRALNQGEEGRRWLRGLDTDIAILVRDWELKLGRVMDGGTEAFVAEAVTSDGEQAVLKIGVPGSDAGRQEARVLEAVAGRGYARLFRHDGARRAMLLERLGPRLEDLGLPPDEQMRIICVTLREAWRPPPTELTLMTGAEKANSLAAFITETWEALHRPCSRRVIDRALGYARHRRDAFAPETAVLAHGDAHASNTLRAGPSAASGFKFIDPDGLFIERAYDLSVSMRGWSQPLLDGDPLALGRERARSLASLTGIELEPIWEWGLIERVSTGLLLKQLGQDEEAGECLAVAESWAAYS